MIFFKKKETKIESEEYTNLYDKLSKMSVKLEELESNLDFLRAEFKSFRKKKLNVSKGDEEEEETKQLNNPVILPDNGFIKRNY